MYYVLLMRHGIIEREATAATAQGSLSAKGRKQVEEVAGALKEFIDRTEGLPDHELGLKQIWHATTPEATQTAFLFHERMAAPDIPAPIAMPALSPENTSPYGPPGNHEPLIDNIVRFFDDTPQTALLIVGHQPLLAWVAEALTGKAHSSERAELLCLRFASRPKRRASPRFCVWLQRLYRAAVAKPAVLRWVLTPSDTRDRTSAELKDKIRGKMEGAKILGVFATAVLGFMLNALLDAKKLEPMRDWKFGVYAAAVAFFLAIVFYFASYYAYDRLLMPVRFWSEAAPRHRNRQPAWLVIRPPSSATWVLYQNMMHIWHCLFTPAMALVYCGLVTLGFAVSRPHGIWLILAIVVTVALAISFKPLYDRLGPRLGAQD